MAIQKYDVIVVGVGGMGSATVYQLAKRGKKVLGIEQFQIAHELGSSHGLSRIIRLAYHEGPEYVAFGKRAYELWGTLQAEMGEKILHITGSVHAGLPESVLDGLGSAPARSSEPLLLRERDVGVGVLIHRRPNEVPDVAAPPLSTSNLPQREALLEVADLGQIAAVRGQFAH